MRKIKNTCLVLMLSMFLLVILFLIPFISRSTNDNLHYYSLLTYCFKFRVKESLFCILIVAFTIMMFIATFMMLFVLYGRLEKRIMFTAIGLVAMSHLLFVVSIFSILCDF